jgi:hypothetical protein
MMTSDVLCDGGRRTHLQRQRRTGRNALDVDASLRASRGPHATHGYAATREAAMAAFAKS